MNACQKSYFAELQGCPCHEKCPNGCDGCRHETCKNRCEDVENYPAARNCFADAERKNEACRGACGYDIDCRRDCLDDFEKALNKCPCGPKCPGGCPCLKCEDCISCEEICEDSNLPALDRCYEDGLAALNTCSDSCYGESCLTCHEKFEKFLDNCPCQPNCIDGCPCENWECAANQDGCEDPSKNRMTKICLAIAEENAKKCRQECGVSFDCIVDCNFAYETELDDCPCAKNCENGCPCEHFNCFQTEATSPPVTTKPSISTTTTKPSMKEDFVLVLHGTGNTFMFDRKSGEKWPLYSFENKEGLGISYGCSVVFKSKMLIIGGNQSSMNKKISKVDGCGIKSHGTLPIAMHYHDCRVYEPENFVMICFPASSWNKCWKYDGEKVQTAQTATRVHTYTKIPLLGKNLLAIGDSKTATVEIFDGKAWRYVGPFIVSLYYNYEVFTFDDRIYCIGGYAINAYSEKVIVGKLETFPVTRVTWSYHSHKLQSPRYRFRTLQWQNEVFIFGGSTTKKIDNKNSLTEHWTLKNNTFTVKTFDHEVANSYLYAELFFVSHTICT